MLLLDIKNLNIELKTDQGWIKIIDHVNVCLEDGKIHGLVGESGSGKSLIVQAIIGIGFLSIHFKKWRVTADRMRFNEIDLLRISIRKRRNFIRHNISMIFKSPKSCLDPLDRIGQQLIKNIPSWTYEGQWWRYLGSWRKHRAIELLHRVWIKDHINIMRSFPYELTEGECQKVMIAIALANHPQLLIADEPTNAMEPIVRTQIFRLLKRLNQNHNITILVISHDFQTLSQWVDKINIIYCGQIVEVASSEDLMNEPYHPYTQALIHSIPNFNKAITHKSRLNTLPGIVPLLKKIPIGCRLGPRCPYAQRKCVHTPPLSGFKNHLYACYFPLNLEKSD